MCEAEAGNKGDDGFEFHFGASKMFWTWINLEASIDLFDVGVVFKVSHGPC